MQERSARLVRASAHGQPWCSTLRTACSFSMGCHRSRARLSCRWLRPVISIMKERHVAVPLQSSRASCRRVGTWCRCVRTRPRTSTFEHWWKSTPQRARENWQIICAPYAHHRLGSKMPSATLGRFILLGATVHLPFLICCQRQHKSSNASTKSSEPKYK